MEQKKTNMKFKEIWKIPYKDVRDREVSDMSLKEFMIFDLKFTFLPYILPAFILFIIVMRVFFK